MRKFLVFICFILAFTTKGMAKETTYTKELFDKACQMEKLWWLVHGLNIVHLVQAK